MNVRVTAALAYGALAAVFVLLWESDSAALDGDAEGALGEIFLAGLLLVHPLAGFLVPRLWALGLPFVALLVSLPFSQPEPELMGITDAGVMFLGGVFAMILMSFGMACRLTLDAFRESR